MQLGVLGVFRRFLNGRTGVTALCDQIGQHALTGRGAQGVHGEDLALGVALAQLLGGDAGGIVGRAQTSISFINVSTLIAAVVAIAPARSRA